MPPFSQVSQSSHPADGLAGPDNWSRLNRGDRVLVRRGRGLAEAGAVDLVAPDASVFWVWLDGGLGRIALHREDDACVWLGEDAG